MGGEWGGGAQVCLERATPTENKTVGRKVWYGKVWYGIIRKGTKRSGPGRDNAVPGTIQ